MYSSEEPDDVTTFPQAWTAGVPFLVALSCCPAACSAFPGAACSSPHLHPGGGKGGASMSRTAAASWRRRPSAKGAVEPEAAGIPRTLQLGAMILVLCVLNIYFNIYNKPVQRVFPFPYTITTFHFAFSSFFITLIWLLNLHPKPRLSLQQYAKILPLALIHVMAIVFANMSLGKVAVSFTHTIKAGNAVPLSVLLLRQTHSLLVLGSLGSVVGGVVLASMTEISFNWIGFCSARDSNDQSRNAFSKKILADKEEKLDYINLFSIMTIMSFLCSVPLTLYLEGIKFSPLFLRSTGLNLQELCLKAGIAATCFHFYQQVSYSLLARILPVTRSLADFFKRVVIISYVLFFRTPISPINVLGTGLPLLGVFMYSRFKKAKSKTNAA
ncbi:phosphoenolpyruvate/phosphate translocator 3, chloroplastic-like [Triticum dicoccoides]|uniref:phosphoenolpyruvate/phosphate translocator 3, chloroplastic-like n=1 Tax=Triticum dicoccoides TaxID=85692 RepID=UPI00188EDC9A|nr:phosphoenolpyruvate/phosphate translocator 3, chloroplastic-like [Triticum dicoccoides]